MKKWIAFVLLAGLTACSSSTTTENTPPATPAPEAQPAAEPAPTPPATPEPAKAADAAPAATADKPAPKPDDKPAVDNTAKKTGANVKPGLYAHFETSLGNFTAELNEKEAPMTVANFMGL